jgi:hypothetical protein
MEQLSPKEAEARVAEVVEVVEPAGVPEVARPELEPVLAARARPERARAAAARVRREQDHQHQKARQAIHNAAPERRARESVTPVPAIPIDRTGAEPMTARVSVSNPFGANQAESAIAYATRQRRERS